MFSKTQQAVVKFCAIECALQESGEVSVAGMVKAWEYATEIDKLDELAVIRLGQLVEPLKNAEGFRRCGVRVGYDIKPDWRTVPDAMEKLLSVEVASAMKDAGEWFRAYEEIHPFRDGNGRTGVILYNWLLGTLDDPEWAPNFWDDPRRTEGFGLGRIMGQPLQPRARSAPGVPRRVGKP